MTRPSLAQLPRHRTARPRPARRIRVRRRGTILVLAIWVILILAALTLVYTRSMRVELAAAGNRLAAEQAAAVEEGAERYVLARIDGAKGDAVDVTSAPAEAVPVGDGFFWIVRPNTRDSKQFEFGVVDESAKLNLNTADALEMAKLPGMTQDFAVTIMDWRDTDSELTGGGAESEYYLAQVPPYNCKNGPLETIEELRLLRGATDSLVYGYDRNQNGASDDVWPSNGLTSTGVPANGPPMLSSLNADERGLAPFVTVVTVENNVDAKGNKRVNVAGKNDGGLTITPGGGAPVGGGQSPASANQVAQPAPPTGQPGQPGQPGGGDQPDAAEAAIKPILTEVLRAQRADEILAKARPTKPYTNVFDFATKGGMTQDELGQVIDRLTSSEKKTIPGRINVNTAPREVLRCLPGLGDDDADTLISRRAGAKPGDSSWVLGALSPEKLNQAGAAITGQSFTYSADIIATSGDGRAFKRVRVVIDGRQSPPIIVRRKDLTSLGWPLSEDLRRQLRSGQRPQTGFQTVRAQGS